MAFSTANSDKKEDQSGVVAKEDSNEKNKETKLADNYEKNPYHAYHSKTKVSR